MGKCENIVVSGSGLAKYSATNWSPHSIHMCWFDVLKNKTNGGRSVIVRFARRSSQDCVLVLDRDCSMTNSKVEMDTSVMEVDLCASTPV